MFTIFLLIMFCPIKYCSHDTLGFYYAAECAASNHGVNCRVRVYQPKQKGL